MSERIVASARVEATDETINDVDARTGRIDGLGAGLARPTRYDRADLHVHLNGAVPRAAILEVLTDEMTKVPYDFNLERDLTRLSPALSLAEYFTPWQVLRLIPRKRSNLDKLTLAAFAEFARNSVRFIELRSSTLYLSRLQQCTPTQALQALIESTSDAAETHGIRRGLILTVTRGEGAAHDLTTLLTAYKDLGEPPDVVGIDLAGDEDTPYPQELPRLFREAKAHLGLGVTIHAGETGRGHNIRTAVDEFDADRIGHGSAAGRDPSLMGLFAVWVGIMG